MGALKLKIPESDSTFTRNTIDVMEAALSELFPRDVINVSDYIEKHRYVSRDESARPGMWDNSITPFAVEPMNAFIESDLEEITMWGSAQVVKTEIIKNILFHIIGQDPAPVLLIYPTEEDARGFSNEKLEPMLLYNQVINEKVAKHNSRNKDNKTLFKKFLGGFLAIVGSNSPQNLARRSVKYVIADDADRITTAGDEGDALSLAAQRTESYQMLGAKILRFSTCTIDGISRIQKSYAKSDQRKYYVPCPYCNYKQLILFDNLVWEKDEELDGNPAVHYPDTVRLKCSNPGCDQLIEEKHKQWMLENGEWIAERPEIIKHRGYWINRLYSPFSTWASHVERFLEVKEDPTQLQVFYNTTLAMTWKIEESDSIDETGLLEKCEDYLTADKPYIPNDIVLITCGVDSQPDRFELQFLGFTPRKVPYVLDYQVIYGNILQEDVWTELEEYVLNKKFTREDGLQLGLRYVKGIHHPVFVDSGGPGNTTQMVYQETKKRFYKGFIAIKGAGGYGKPILLNRSNVGPRKDAKLQNLGVDALKTSLYKLIKSDAVHFSRAVCDINYFRQLTNEKAVVKYDRRLGKQIEWILKKKNARVEALDTWGYAYAAMIAMNPNWQKLKERYEAEAEMMKNNLELTGEPQQENKKTKKRTRIVRHAGYGGSVY